MSPPSVGICTYGHWFTSSIPIRDRSETSCPACQAHLQFASGPTGFLTWTTLNRDGYPLGTRVEVDVGASGDPMLGHVEGRTQHQGWNGGEPRWTYAIRYDNHGYQSDVPAEHVTPIEEP